MSNKLLNSSVLISLRKNENNECGIRICFPVSMTSGDLKSYVIQILCFRCGKLKASQPGDRVECREPDLWIPHPFHEIPHCFTK
jgi:hypothetical protein